MRQVGVRRVGFDERDGFTWLDNASWCERVVAILYQQAVQHNDVDSAWANDDGSFLHLFKAEAKFRILQHMADISRAINEQNGEFVAPIMALLACVVMI